MLSDFDRVLDIVSDPIGNGDQATLEIRFLQSAGDLSINVSRRDGITDAGAELVSFQIQIDDGLSLPFHHRSVLFLTGVTPIAPVFRNNPLRNPAR